MVEWQCKSGCFGGAHTSHIIGGPLRFFRQSRRPQRRIAKGQLNKNQIGEIHGRSRDARHNPYLAPLYLGHLAIQNRRIMPATIWGSKLFLSDLRRMELPHLTYPRCLTPGPPCAYYGMRSADATMCIAGYLPPTKRCHLKPGAATCPSFCGTEEKNCCCGAS